MSKSCPISSKKIDGTIVRIGAFFIALIIICYLFTDKIFLLYILVIDFFIRIYGKKIYSPVYQLSVTLKKILNLNTDMVDAAPKRLATQFGLIFSIALVVEAIFKLYIALYVTSFILLSCALLEGIVNYCVGCKIYYIFKKIGL